MLLIARLLQGSLRNSLITDQHDMLFSGTEGIKCVATRFGAVWLAKSAFTFSRPARRKGHLCRYHRGHGVHRRMPWTAPGAVKTAV